MGTYSPIILHRVLALHSSFATRGVETREIVQVDKDVICLPPRPDMLCEILLHLLSLLLLIIHSIRLLLLLSPFDTLPFHSR